MDRGPRTPYSVSSACLTSGLNHAVFAPKVARSLYPNFDSAPPTFTRSFNIPAHGGGVPCKGDVDGMESTFVMAAIDKAKPWTAPGHNGIPYEVYKNMEGPALQGLLDSVELRRSSDHAETRCCCGHSEAEEATWHFREPATNRPYRDAMQACWSE